MIKTFKQIKEIIEPIPADKFMVDKFGDGDGNCCFLGHIHVHFSKDKDPCTDFVGDWDGYGARMLTRRFISEVHHLEFEDGSSVNNSPNINGYNEPVIKDRLMHMIEDGIKWEESNETLHI